MSQAPERASYRAGDVLFREGEASDFACRVLEGEARILKRHDDTDVVLGLAKAGDFLGEMGVIEDAPRSATVEAAGELRVEIYPKAVFLQRISDDPALARQLLVRLSERLKTINRAYASSISALGAGQRLHQPEPVAEATPGLGLRLFADSAAMAVVMPAEGLSIDKLPFVVGRAVDPGEPRPALPLDLMLADRQPYRLSRRHFAIDRGERGPVVRDLDSALGTLVEGRGLGRMFPADEAAIAPGETIIQAGGDSSTFRFRLVIEG